MTARKSPSLAPPTKTVSGRHEVRRHGFPLSALLVLTGALLFGAVLNAESLLATATALQPGWERDVAVTISNALVAVEKTIHLDVGRMSIERGLGLAPSTTVAAPPSKPTSPTITTTPPTSPVTTAPQPSTTVTTVATTSTIPGVFAPTKDRPARLWIAGDSLTERFGPSLVNLLTASGVVDARRDVKYSSGLTRPDFFDWPGFLDQQLAADPAEILVFMIGANDGQPIETGAGWIPFGSDAWTGEYRQRVAATMDLLAEQVPTIYWIGQPIARSAEYSAKMALMDQVYESEAALRPSIRYFDTWPLFSDGDGEYSAYLPGPEGNLELMRSTDGIHLTVEGGDRLAAAVVELITADWPLSITGG